MKASGWEKGGGGTGVGFEQLGLVLVLGVVVDGEDQTPEIALFEGIEREERHAIVPKTPSSSHRVSCQASSLWMFFSSLSMGCRALIMTPA